MSKFRFLFFILLILCNVFSLQRVSAADTSSKKLANPAYVGLLAGYGHSTWGALISPSPDWLITQSTPVSATDNGVVWGALLGYQMARHFALEAFYVHFPKNTVRFVPFSFYSPIDEIHSKTNVYSMVLKFIVPIKKWELDTYANAGLSLTQRKDELANRTKLGATFGLGFLKDINPRWTADFSFQYHTGYGLSEIRPAMNYIPFLVSGQVRILYRFSLFRAKS